MISVRDILYQALCQKTVTKLLQETTYLNETFVE